MSEMWYISFRMVGISNTLNMSTRDITRPHPHTCSVTGIRIATCLNIRKFTPVNSICVCVCVCVFVCVWREVTIIFWVSQNRAAHVHVQTHACGQARVLNALAARLKSNVHGTGQSSCSKINDRAIIIITWFYDCSCLKPIPTYVSS